MHQMKMALGTNYIPTTRGYTRILLYLVLKIYYLNYRLSTLKYSWALAKQKVQSTDNSYYIYEDIIVEILQTFAQVWNAAKPVNLTMEYFRLSEKYW